MASKLNTIRTTFLIILCIFTSLKGLAQITKGDVIINENGVMKWSGTQEEVKGFGVNYSVPFAHAYRSAEKKGLDIKREIDKDVYHFKRLGFDLYRLHVWDTEISDEKGNLIENEHLDAFDYLLKKLKDHNINFVITPIAFWGNGWPEPDEDTPGFSNTYGKDASLTNPEAIKAQQNYLRQFVNHVNPYTNVAYKDEPNVIAFEVSNEPHHRGTPESVTQFISKMVTAIKSTGSKKPVFYNISHSVHLADAYFDAGIDGGTFQWYPTGLGFQQELEGNLLPNVDDYHIPFNNVIQNNGAAKLVYEFDAADVNKSYMYPAMARSFREAGIQIATHFAYDPTFLAYANTEYNTHYMNLNYTPHKALGLMIASEIFHETELGKDLGTYPANLEFGDFKIRYESDLAIYNSAEKFIYTNTNTIEPKNLSELKHIAGHGNSKLITYDGKGAYFLDKLDEKIWRLEVMPDPFLIDNPFGRNSLDRTISVISWKANKMTIELPGLKERFTITGINEDNSFSGLAEASGFQIYPGTYILSAENAPLDIKQLQQYFDADIDGFEAQKETVDKTYLLHEPLSRIETGDTLKINASLVSNVAIEKVEAWFRNGNIYDSVVLEANNAYDYSADIPEKLLQKGFLEYRIIVQTSEGAITFPGEINKKPSDWDFAFSEVYITRIEEPGTPVYLFDAIVDSEKMVRKWSPKNNVVPVNGNDAEFQVRIDQLFEEDIENKNASPVFDYSFRYNFQQKTGKRSLKGKNTLVLKARALEVNTDKLQVALIMNNGAAYGKIIDLTSETQEIRIQISQLKPVKTVSLPRPYPSFLPYYFQHENPEGFDMERVEAVQFSIGPGIKNDDLQKPHGVGIIDLKLE